MSAELQRRQFTVDEYYRMAAAGVLKPDDRLELIEGEIIKMIPIGSPHAACVSRLDHLLQRSTKLDAIVAVQNPVRLSNFSEPVPDVAVLSRRDDFYAARHPAPQDVLLIIEVGDTTVLTDRRIKLPLYARSRIPEVWLVALPIETVEGFWNPSVDVYRENRSYGRGDVVVANTIEGLSIAVDDIFGPAG